MDADAYQALKPDPTNLIEAHVQNQLYNDALMFISMHARLKERYGYMEDEIDELALILSEKCPADPSPKTGSNARPKYVITAGLTNR